MFPKNLDGIFSNSHGQRRASLLEIVADRQPEEILSLSISAQVSVIQSFKKDLEKAQAVYKKLCEEQAAVAGGAAFDINKMLDIVDPKPEVEADPFDGLISAIFGDLSSLMEKGRQPDGREGGLRVEDLLGTGPMFNPGTVTRRS